MEPSRCGCISTASPTHATGTSLSYYRAVMRGIFEEDEAGHSDKDKMLKFPIPPKQVVNDQIPTTEDTTAVTKPWATTGYTEYLLDSRHWAMLEQKNEVTQSWRKKSGILGFIYKHPSPLWLQLYIRRLDQHHRYSVDIKPAHSPIPKRIPLFTNMASSKPNAILSLIQQLAGGATVRARVDNLIRYVNIPKDVLDSEPGLTDGDDPKVLKLDYPSGAKCLEVYRGFDTLTIRPLQLELKGIEGIWYPVSLDYDTFEDVVPLPGKSAEPSDRVCTAKHPELKSYGKVIMKIAELPANWPAPNGGPYSSKANLEAEMAREIRMHRDVVELGLGIAPTIFGLYVEGARSFDELNWEDKYRMTEADKKGCRDLLQKLHDNGFLHGDIHPGNLLRRPDGSVLLIDFQATSRVNGEGHVEGSVVASQTNERQMSLESWLATF
ncbi:kinase-like domain-containing protein [Apiospora rasikravindrae]|uniref:Kinase-like domain-containing protein n=1 Tax=Apiospora rasikravindrae TaxID=990691 RepID=A0ABR1SKZ8_9PEZI